MRPVTAAFVGGLILYGLCLALGMGSGGCTAAQQQAGAHTLTVASSLCESIALAKGREDIAALCRATRDGAVVLDKATEPMVCEVPDAGRD